jgi:site-specific DNA recombinase
MIAAIYARKSTDQNIADEEKSVTRQIERARAYAALKGWIVADEHVYVDDGISGAEFVKRPGFIRLMNALKPRPPFHVLVMSEEARLGREQIETAWTLKQIMDAGVRVFFYLEDRERTLDSAMEKVMLSLTNFAAEMEREKARQRTRDALHRKASRGHVAGGKVYGYRNVRAEDRVTRVIVPEEAAVIRRIFTAIAGGRGFTRIAKDLNAEAVPCPARGRGWATSGVREIVLRELYRGRIVWGRTRRVHRGGTRGSERRPPSEWLTQEAPEVRIVAEELWGAAHARLDATRAAYRRLTNGRLVGRPASATRTPYLLSTLLACGTCGGPMHATKRTGQRAQPRYYYVCTTHRVRGDHLCANALSAPMERLDAAWVDGLARTILTPDLVDDVVQRAIELRAAAREERAAQRPEEELRRLEGELSRYAEAIATSGPLPSLLKALQTRERRRLQLEEQLRRPRDGGSEGWRPDDLRRRLLKRLDDWRALLDRQRELARETVIRPLLSGRIVLEPRVTPEGRFYDFEGKLSFGAVVAGLIGAGDGRVMTVVAPG